MSHDVVDALVSPISHLAVLSKMEVNRLLDDSRGSAYRLYRNCSLAVLNSGDLSDDTHEVLTRFAKFKVSVVSQERGIKLKLKNAPASAFVDGKMNIPNLPGLGVDLNEDAIAEHPYQKRDLRHFNGELTNIRPDNAESYFK